MNGRNNRGKGGQRRTLAFCGRFVICIFLTPLLGALLATQAQADFDSGDIAVLEADAAIHYCNCGRDDQP